MDVISACWLEPVVLDGSGEILWGWRPAVFPALYAGRDTIETDTHRRFLRGCTFGPGCNSRRLHFSYFARVGPRLAAHARCALGPPLRGGSLRPSLAAAGASDVEWCPERASPRWAARARGALAPPLPGGSLRPSRAAGGAPPVVLCRGRGRPRGCPRSLRARAAATRRFPPALAWGRRRV